MRAKTINEIKRGDEASGINNLGIGHSTMNAAYKNSLVTSPHIAAVTTIDNHDMRWGSLLPLKEIIPKLLESPLKNIIMVGSRSINDETEKYLHSQVFNDAKYLLKTNISLDWKDTETIVEASIYTNDIKGASIVEYTTPEDRFIVYFFFRKQ